MSGIFLSLEGGEGAGKSTQARRLAEALRDRGIAVLVTREPGGSPGAEAIRNLLMQGDVARWDSRVETLLFAAARGDHVARVIRPAIAAGTWVICDRFLDSTRAYQGAQGISDEAIVALHAFGSDGLMPDRTLLLDVDPAEGARRSTDRDGPAADRFAARDGNFHSAVADRFDAIAAREPARVRRVDAIGDPPTVTARLLDALCDLLP